MPQMLGTWQCRCLVLWRFHERDNVAVHVGHAVALAAVPMLPVRSLRPCLVDSDKSNLASTPSRGAHGADVCHLLAGIQRPLSSRTFAACIHSSSARITYASTRRCARTPRPSTLPRCPRPALAGIAGVPLWSGPRRPTFSIHNCIYHTIFFTI
jgi:hypothetical protein